MNHWPSSRPKLGGTLFLQLSLDSGQKPRMSLKNICRIPRSWTLADYRRHTCRDGSHIHTSLAQLAPLEKNGLVIWLKHPETRNDSGVCWIVEHVKEVDRFEYLGSGINTGLSSRVGEYLAVEIYRKQVWASVMLSDITGSDAINSYIDP
jgi:hypothetical protein